MKNLSLIFAVICFALIQIVLTCPPGWDKTSYGCKSVQKYGRGTGYPWRAQDGLSMDGAKKRCKKDHPELGCSEYGGQYYPKCRRGFKNDLCCICSFYGNDLDEYELYKGYPDNAFLDVKIKLKST